MAETGAVFDVAVPDEPRTPEQIMGPDGGSSQEKPPRAQNRWYTCDITAGRDVTPEGRAAYVSPLAACRARGELYETLYD